MCILCLLNCVAAVEYEIWLRMSVVFFITTQQTCDMMVVFILLTCIGQGCSCFFGFLICMSNICNRLCSSGQPACVAKIYFRLRENSLTNFFHTRLTDTIDVECFILLSVTLTLAGGPKVRAKPTYWIYFLAFYSNDQDPISCGDEAIQFEHPDSTFEWIKGNDYFSSVPKKTH